MRALIVGGAGFVGQYLAEALRGAGQEVFVTKLGSESVSFPATVFDLDLNDPAAIAAVLERSAPDVIYHLAAQSSVKLSWEKPALTAQINAVGAVNLYEGIRTVCPDARCLVVGSSEEYGNIDYTSAVSEETVPRPGNVYALTKYFQEELARVYSAAYGLDFVMTRSFNHIGPRQSRNFVVADFCAQTAEIEAGMREPVIYTGDLEVYRDFTDVRDVVRAYLLLAERGKRGETYNVGSGNSVKIADILKTVLSLSPHKIRVERDPKKFRPSEIPRICADRKKISALGWEPSIPILDTIQDTLTFYRGTISNQ